MLFYVFIVIISCLYLVNLSWQTRLKSEHYIRYCKVCESGLLSMLCHKYKSHLVLANALFTLFFVCLTWCMYKCLVGLGWLVWEVYVILPIYAFAMYVYFLRKQLMLVLADKYVLHL